MEVILNGLIIEITQEDGNVCYPGGYWKNTKIKIYDALDDLSEREKRSVIEYLYDEGFIQVRRVIVEVVKGKS